MAGTRLFIIMGVSYLFVPQIVTPTATELNNNGIIGWYRNNITAKYGTVSPLLAKIGCYENNIVLAAITTGLAYMALSNSSAVSNYSIGNSYHNIYYFTSVISDVTGFNSELTVYNNIDDVLIAMDDGQWDITSTYPINYTANNCTLSAPSTASPGQDVVININPATGYSFRGASGVTITDSYGDNVPYIVQGNQIAFTMPQP